MEAHTATSDRFVWSLWGLGLVAVGVWLPGRLLPAVVAIVTMVECARSFVRANRVLPERVASHFNFARRPDGWMSRRWFLIVMGGVAFALAVALPLGFIAVTIGQGNVKAQRLALWSITLGLCMFGGLNELSVRANLRDPMEMPEIVWGLLGTFMVAINSWGLAPLAAW